MVNRRKIVHLLKIVLAGMMRIQRCPTALSLGRWTLSFVETLRVPQEEDVQKDEKLFIEARKATLTRVI
jgi:hypothetical protein